MAPLDDHVGGPFYLVFEPSELSAAVRYTTAPDDAEERFAEDPLKIGRHVPGARHRLRAGDGAAAKHASRVLPVLSW